MPPNSLENKIVSLHLQGCQHLCSNSSVCYLLGREIQDSQISNTDRFRMETLVQGVKVHESVCTTNGHYHMNMLRNFRNYNITISKRLIFYFDAMDWQQFSDRIQVSIYTWDDARSEYLAPFQKLFLIKDTDTLVLGMRLLETCHPTGKVHLLLDQKFINKNMILDLIKRTQNRNNLEVSLDTCLTSFIINGKCPYQDNNYVDIHYDGTLRTCPYKEQGITYNANRSLVSDDLEEIFRIKFPENNCIYKEIFKGTNNERNQDPSVQDNTTNNGLGSSGKRMRRFSLRR